MTLFWLLLALFVAIALMVKLGERYARTPDAAQLARLRRWLLPLVGLMLVLSLLDFYLA